MSLREQRTKKLSSQDLAGEIKALAFVILKVKKVKCDKIQNLLAIPNLQTAVYDTSVKLTLEEGFPDSIKLSGPKMSITFLICMFFHRNSMASLIKFWITWWSLGLKTSVLLSSWQFSRRYGRVVQPSCWPSLLVSNVLVNRTRIFRLEIKQFFHKEGGREIVFFLYELFWAIKDSDTMLLFWVTILSFKHSIGGCLVKSMKRDGLDFKRFWFLLWIKNLVSVSNIWLLPSTHT